MRFLQHHGKIGIRKPEAERIADTVRRKGFKIAVAYVNIFLVNVFKCSAVIGCGRVIRQAVTNGIRQLSAGGNSAGNHIGGRISALLSAVPYIKNGCDRIFTGFLQKTHVNDTGYVENDGGLFKMSGHHGEQFFFRGVQAVAAFRILIVLAFASCPAQDYQRFVRIFRSFFTSSSVTGISFWLQGSAVQPPPPSSKGFSWIHCS